MSQRHHKKHQISAPESQLHWLLMFTRKTSRGGLSVDCGQLAPAGDELGHGAAGDPVRDGAGWGSPDGAGLCRTCRTSGQVDVGPPGQVDLGDIRVTWPFVLPRGCMM